MPGPQIVGMSRKTWVFYITFYCTTALLFWSLEQARYPADVEVTSVISRLRKMMGKSWDLLETASIWDNVYFISVKAFCVLAYGHKVIYKRHKFLYIF